MLLVNPEIQALRVKIPVLLKPAFEPSHAFCAYLFPLVVDSKNPNNEEDYHRRQRFLFGNGIRDDRVESQDV
jgi:hypothetical protein